MLTYKILIGSPIRQKPAILTEFLQSLLRLEKENISVDFLFIDDNELEESRKLLNDFSCQLGKIEIIKGDKVNQYLCDEGSHHWQEALIWKVAEYKDYMINTAAAKNYDFLFLIDSDIILHPRTLMHLISTQKDIISEIFWTKWKPDVPPLPQVWVSDQYNLFYRARNQELSQEEANSRINGFLHCLQIPGIYEVGGLGACTLISQKSLRSGVSFKEISNLSFWGEDRHFCIRAEALGFKLFVDTFYPAFHIYRESELDGALNYKETLQRFTYPYGTISARSNTKSQGNKLTLAMLVRNEADRYLPQVLKHIIQYIDEAVILDDASEDNTVDVCRNILQGIPLHLVSNKSPGFHNEIILRKQLWDVTVSTNPDWILCLDADEVFEDRAKNEIGSLINQPYYDYYAFRLYDFWSPTHYREDKYWEAHKYYRNFLIRHQPHFLYKWQESPLHCGRFPANITDLPGAVSKLRVKHLGWAAPEDRLKKYQRYMKQDPEGKYGIMEQYKSILDPQPNLVEWEK
ncbi:MAG: glycosyl transferase [Clostridiaceae bacterium BRH_c20a]|nr:MAG: glycosyl transferase [Clostridiaceae bacterium BRH_c20a]